MTLETQLKHQCRDYLKMKSIFRWHNLAGIGVYPGIPDDFILVKGVLYGLEYKAPKGHLSPYQEAFKANLEANGGKFIEVRDLNDILKLFKPTPRI